MLATHEKVRCKHWEHIITGVKRYPQECSLGVQSRICLNVVVYLILGFKVRYKIFPVRDSHSIGESAPDVMLQRLRSGCCIGQILALLNFDFNS